MNTMQMMVDCIRFSQSEHSYQDWADKMTEYMLEGDTKLTLYTMFKSLVSDDYIHIIPLEYELDLFLKCIYAFHAVDKTYVSILRKMINREPGAHKLSRENDVRSALRDYIDDEGYATLYRGISGNTDCKQALSYTLNKDIAYWFACRFLSDTASVISARVPVERVLIYTNARHEQEVIVMPLAIKGKPFMDIVTTKVQYERNKIESIHDQIINHS